MNSDAQSRVVGASVDRMADNRATATPLANRTRSVESVLTVACVAAGLLSIWLVFHPFDGVWHDAVIYFGQAQAGLAPERFAGDVLLGRDPQAGFTIFPTLIGGLVEIAGQKPAAMIFMAAAHGLWLIGGAWFARAIAPDLATAAVVLLFLIVWPNEYGLGVFGYAENFPTARPLAEAFVLMALAASVGRRRFLVGGLGLAALVLHPITAAAGLPVAAIMLCRTNGQRIFVVAAGAAAILLAVGLLWAATSTMTAGQITRIEALKEASPHLFVGEWYVKDWRGVAWTVALLVIAALWDRGPLRILGLASLAGLVLALGLSFTAGDLLGNSLILQAQPWRFVWIASLIAVAIAGSVAFRLWAMGGTATALTALFLASLALGIVWTPALLPLLAVSFALKYRQVSRRPASAAWSVALWTAAFFILVVAILASASLGSILGLVKQLFTGWQGILKYPETRLHFFEISVGETAALLLFLLAVGAWFSRTKGMFTVLPLVIVSVSLIGSALFWDRALPSVINAHDRERLAKSLTAGLPDGQGVYSWPSSRVAWFLLRRPSYYSGAQVAPAVFSKNLSTAIFQRRRLTLPLRKVLANRPLDAAKAGALFLDLCRKWKRPRLLVMHRRIDAPVHARVALGRRYFLKWYDGQSTHAEPFDHLYSYACPAG